MAKIKDISTYLPQKVLSNEELATRLSNWTPEKIFEKTGIKFRHIAEEDETTSDMAISAANRLLSKSNFDKEKIDMLFLITQTQDQCLPSSSCRIHKELGLSKNCGTFDINQGCSGYIYGLSVAKGLINSGDVNNVLMLTADTYTKLIDPEDSSVVTLFGDGATATLIVPEEGKTESIGPCFFGTDGSKGDFLRCDFLGLKKKVEEQKYLLMNGPGILNFTLSKLPEELNDYLNKYKFRMHEFDLVVFHQANKFILKNLYKKIGIEDKGVISLENTGNTVSSSIPMVLEDIILKNSKTKRKILLGGFGVGLSWAFTSVVI